MCEPVELIQPDGVYNDILRIYLDSFPPEERRPFEQIADGQLPLRLLAVMRGGYVVGMLTYWDFNTFRYVEHFAIESEMRGKNIGTLAMSLFLEQSPVPVVLEVERPESGEFAVRRIRFYERLGFHALADYDYIQPPYAEGLSEVPLLLMSTDPSIDPGLIASVLHHEVYGVK